MKSSRSAKLSAYCPEASSEGLLCPPGTRWPFGRAENVTDCIPCFPGSFNNVPGAPFCAGCEQGSYTAEYGATACDPCPAGQHLEPRAQLSEQ